MMEDNEMLQQDSLLEHKEEGINLEHQNTSPKRPVRAVKYFKKNRKRNSNLYVVLILAVAMLGSNILGSIIISRSTYELGKQSALLQQVNSKNNVSNSGSGSVDQGLVTNMALPKNSSITEIAKKVGVSVVGIRTTVNSSRSSFWGVRSGQSQEEGSGIIISQDGYIMTNYHVVQNADPKSNTSKNAILEVFLSDERQAKAKFVGGDSVNDLAVIKIDLADLPVAELGDSSQLEVGELAVAIGNPLGMEFAGSVTAGIISAVNRKIDTNEKTLTFIQTDAAINPGNSGGALVNSQGQVVGVNSIKISTTGVEGLGFAIPINTAKPIVDQLIMFGYVKNRPFIGISGTEITETMSKQYGLPVGLYVTGVTTGSGADSAGIKKGDVLVSLADKEVKTMVDLNNIKEDYKAGDTVNAVVVRNSNKMTLKLTFTEQK